MPSGMDIIVVIKLSAILVAFIESLTYLSHSCSVSAVSGVGVLVLCMCCILTLVYSVPNIIEIGQRVSTLDTAVKLTGIVFF